MVKLNKKVTVNVEARRIKICAKPSDAGYYTLLDQNNQVIHEVDGYVPRWLGNDDTGDYIEMTIDIETGYVVDWKRPSAVELERWMDEDS